MNLRIWTLPLLCLISVLPTLASASGTIVHATRRLRMSNAEPLPAKDFYVNLGARDGVQVGDRLPVLRALSVRDTYDDANNVHLFQVPMGFLEVINVGDTACIGREVAGSAPGPLPSLQYMGFLVGDEVLAKTSLPSGSAAP